MDQKIHQEGQGNKHQGFRKKIEPKRKVSRIPFETENQYVTNGTAHQEDNDFPEKDWIELLVLKKVIPGLDIKEIKSHHGIKCIQDRPDDGDHEDKFRPVFIYG